MANKKSKFLFYINCVLLLSAMGLFFGLYFQTRSVYAFTNETCVVAESEQDGDTILLNDIFENYTQTSLKKEYKDKDVLEKLKANGQITVEQFSRAVDVLNGNVKFTQRREFSTEFDNDNKIDQVGDIAKYSQTELKCIWPASEIILTGIYGLQEETFNIFVEANESDKLPSVLFSQNHGYYLHWYEERQLKKGWNKIKFPSFGRGLVADDEIWGGAIYLCNPYFQNEQGEVKVYIEGGGYYPVFRKGGNEKEFLSFLEEYENERKSKRMLDMAELVTDHAIITTTSSSLYEVYFENDVITPTENLNLWGDYFTRLFEFNGIPTSEKSNVGRAYDPRNDYVKINFRYMTVYQGSGAYSFSYHIGWYYEHYWFANFYNAKHPLSNHGLSNHLLFGIGHELGHALDNEPRKINETTNNFTAAMAFFNIVGMPHVEQYQPFQKTLNALSNDYALNYKAYDDGQIMYTKTDYPNNYDHNYLIWWDLEAVFPGFWARLNNYFRQPLKEGLSKEELYVYYSSLATGVDLSNYYERWGFYYGKPSNVSGRFISANASNAFKDAMQKATESKQISKQYDHFWYVDGAQYNFMLTHQNVAQNDRDYKNGKPTITKISKSNNQHTVFINSDKDEYHLGYEVFSKVNNESWKLVGFTYTSSFVDNHYYSSTPTYKVQAVNRFFKVSAESDPVSDVAVESLYVCKVNDVLYYDLSTAITQAKENSTIYLLNDCTIKEKYIVKNITLQIDETVNNDIYIYNKGTTSTFVVQSNFSLIGKENAKIIFDGGGLSFGNPTLYATNGKTIIKNAIFRNLNTSFLAGAVYSTGADLEIYNTSFDACNSAKGDATVYASKSLKLEQCVFSNNFLDVYVKNLDNLTIANEHSKFSLGFDKFEGEKTVAVEGDVSEIEKQIDFKVDGYMTAVGENQIVVKPLSFKLKFNHKTVFEYTIYDVKFVFGEEDFVYDLQENQYVEYEECVSGQKFKTGDKIVVEKDMEFDVQIKDKLCLKTFYNDGQSLEYYPYGEEIFLPTIDKNQNEVLLYKNGDRIFSAGQIYTIKTDSTLVAVYAGNLTYRYFVRDEIYSVGYGNYGQIVKLLQLEEDGFLGWRSDGQIVSGTTILKDDADFVAVFSEELPKVYDLSQCEIQIDGTYTFSGEQIIPKITVYFKGLIVPEGCYEVSCSNNIFASKQAQVTISSVQGLSTGENSQNFTILPKRLGKNDIKVTGLQNFVYDGTQTSQNLTVTYQNQAVTFSINYDGDRINAGDVQIEIVFSGNYSGTIYLQYVIAKAERSGFRVFLPDWVYGGNPQSPTVEGEMENSQITYSYSRSRGGSYSSETPKNAGNYWIKAVIEESQNYNSAEDVAQFTIEKADHPEPMPSTQMTVGRKIETLQSVKLIDGWTWERPSTKIIGETMTAMAVYFDKENYKTYQIQITLTKEPRKNVSSLRVDLDVKSFVYDGHEKTPNVIAKDGAFSLVKGIDYEVEYKNNTFAGQASVVVKGINAYTGTKEITFTISKAEKPNVDEIIRLDHKVAKLSDIQLPNGFVWENANLEITGKRMTAKAIYVGKDAENYEKKEIDFEIVVESETNNLIWLAIVVPIAVALVGCGIFAIIRRKRNKWW